MIGNGTGYSFECVLRASNPRARPRVLFFSLRIPFRLRVGGHGRGYGAPEKGGGRAVRKAMPAARATGRRDAGDRAHAHTHTVSYGR